VRLSQAYKASPYPSGDDDWNMNVIPKINSLGFKPQAIEKYIPLLKSTF
jgi:hypothetical protein